MKKRIVSTVIAATVAACVPLMSCGEKKSGSSYKLYMPDGAPAIAVSALMSKGFDDTEFTVVQATAIAQFVANGTADLAIMPINAAAKLYNDGVGIKMLSVNTHGNLYLVGAGEDVTLDDLAGKRVGVIGQGQVPDLTIRMMLDEKGIDYEVSSDAVNGKVALQYGADGKALLPLLGNGSIDYAFLAEPAATTAVKQQNKTIVMDAQEQWLDIFGVSYPQACLVAKTSVGSDYIEKLLTALEASDDWAKTHSIEAVAAVKAHMISGADSTLPDSMSEDTISRCNIDTVRAVDCVARCEVFFAKLTEMTTPLGAPVLSSVPDKGFFYGVTA
ncbi:MAG: ABC transporter substrate-binding protein [Clostridiales bacterium]|nr:ABC transporter substrate-binding protein [Clostridiales bacterium]